MNKIDGVIFKQMIISASNNLFNHYPEVDALNVFPVPDGDTGTNMNLTMSSGVKEVANRTDKSITTIAKAFSRGLLMGARGNSGVILSQIFRGFSQGLNNKDEIDALELAEAFNIGKEVAYKAVMRPVEGTILTVVREAAVALNDAVRPNMPITKAMEIFYAEAQASLVRTPDLLPVLKEVGVVDSGGAGFCKIVEGFVKALKNEIVQREQVDVLEAASTGQEKAPSDTSGAIASFEHKETFYSTSFTLKLPSFKDPSKREFIEDKFTSVLSSHGDSVTVEKKDTLVKAHINTKFPGNILSFAQQYGEFVDLKIDNVGDSASKENKKAEKQVIQEKPQAKEDVKPVEAKKAEPKAEKKEYGLIACCSGKGVEDIFKSQRIDYIVSGGQTMNPSTEDFVKAIEAVNAKNVFIFPNNGNIIMAATQASQVVTDRHVYVIPSKTIPQGIVASMMFNPEVEPEDNKEEMTNALATVKTGQVTFAIRDSLVDGISVKKDQFIGINEKKIELCTQDKVDCVERLLSNMVDDMSSVITILVGEGVTSGERKKVESFINEKYGEDIDVDIKDGLQPVYSFIVGVE